ncbi:MAG: polymer-forming cytoskeletal protein [Pseudomonadota bacterium]|nr:polymer-forming cytoskeletal protein [Pseudomonadota bacterium]
MVSRQLGLRWQGVLVASALMILSTAACALQLQWAESIERLTPAADDLYAMGRDIRVGSSVEGDLYALALDLQSDGLIVGDLTVAAGQAEIGGTITDDLRAAGRTLVVQAEVSDHLLAAAAEIEVRENTEVGGGALLTGRTVAMHGRIVGDLRVFARRVQIDGTVDGNLHVRAESVDLTGATIGGDLVLESPGEVDVKGAAIGGAVTQTRIDPLHPSSDGADTNRWPGAAHWIGVLLVAALLAWKLPEPISATVAGIDRGVLRALGLGLIAAAVPPATVLLLLWIPIGWIGAITAALLYPLWLLAGVYVGLFWLADVLLRRVGPRAPGWVLRTLAFTGVLAAVALLGGIPWVGRALWTGVLLMGLGGLVQALVLKARTRQPPAPPSPAQPQDG